MKSPVSTRESPVFRDDLAEAVAHLRSGLSDLLGALPEIGRASEVSQSLGIDRNLGWKIWRTARASNPLEAVPFLVSTEGYEKLLRAAQRRGVNRDILNSVRLGVETVSKAMSRHAGDRASLEIMAAEAAEGDGGSSGGPRSIARRRACFHGNSAVWGVQAAATYRAQFFGRSDTPGIVRTARVWGLVGLQRMRPNVKWTVGRMISIDGTSKPTIRADVKREPLDTRSVAEGLGAPVLLDFSSQPLPQFHRVVRAERGTIDFQVTGGLVGSMGNSTVMLGEFTPHAGPSVRDESNTDVAAGVQLYTPCKMLVHDVFIEKGLFPPQVPSSRLYSELGVPQWPACGEDARLPLDIEIEAIDLSNWKKWDVARCAEVPRTSEMASMVFDRLGWDASRFQLHRVRLPFPPIPTTMVMRVELG